MKNFLTSMLGALAALLIFAFGGLLLFMGLVGAVASVAARRAAKEAKAVEPGSYLVFDLNSNIVDSPPLFDFGPFGGPRNENLQLREVTRALRTAASDPAIKGVLLLGSLQPQGYGTGFAALREVRAALEAFHKQGKPIKAYLEFATTRDYYLASVADEVTLDPYGVIFMPGLAVEPTFFAGAFEKFGVGVQVTRVGKYKSYVEPFIRKDMSPEDRQQTQELLDDIWKSLLGDIGRSRRLTPARIQAVVDAQGLIRADAAKQAGLVDRVAYRDQVIDELKAATNQQPKQTTFKQVSLESYLRDRPFPSVSEASRPAIAIVYAEGEIVDGEGQYGEVGGVSFAREIRQLRQDDHVKAIVLRVNSPGGSVSAAEDIQREVRLARQAKPVIVSMGSYAASGGYWISAYADRIFAEPTTITGSIGVFGIQFDVQKLLGNLGVTFDRVKTGRFADSLTITRPKTPEELAVLQGMVDWIYDKFIEKVAEGRKLPRGKVEEIAQGRVWSGLEARRLGLVDEVGGLANAIQYARQAAGLKEGFQLVEYPSRKKLGEALADLFGRVIPDSVRERAAGPAAQVQRRLSEATARLRAFNDPQGTYALLPMDLTVR